jgi:phosphatidylethanolamine/phosphatidyl-N-methylethanolamine N-methyltransferase
MAKARDEPALKALDRLVSTADVSPFEEQLRFLRGLFARPRNVGAIAPSSPELAKAIADQIDPEMNGPILELGPGTGVVTAALIARGVAPERITAIEYDREFVDLVAQRFPRLRIIQGDAFDLKATLGDADRPIYAGIISGLPLLNHAPLRRRTLIETALARLLPGAPYVQFSYGLTPPIPAPKGCEVSRAAVIWKNLPPARVWVYRATTQ